WIALTTTIVLAIAASVLWWRLSHAGIGSQPSASSSPMQVTAETSSASASNSDPGSAAETQTGNMPEIPLAPIQLTPQRMQSIGIVLGKVESKTVNSELRFY